LNRISAAFLIFALGALTAGCANTPPATSPLSVNPAEDIPGMTSPVLRAREDYLGGVRAFVEEDYESTEELLARCLSQLEPITEDHWRNEEERREARQLQTKTHYFLQKISERRATTPDSLLAAPEVEENADSSWKLVTRPITPEYNSRVEEWVHYFMTDGHPDMEKWLSRQPRYQPVFDRIFARYGLPRELTYHGMIESGFSTDAYSWAHAAGLWQFIRGTGRKYDLRIDWWVDERRDPEKSTEAAARYLRDLYGEFGDWNLALAAYNAGEGKVRAQIRRQGTADFWRLRLPRETRNHIPKFYAAMSIAMNPLQHGLHPEYTRADHVEPLEVDFCVDFDVLGRCCGVSAQILADLNPALIRKCTPPGGTPYTVHVPMGTAERGRRMLARIPSSERVEWVHHTVRRGETLSGIALRYGTTVSAIVGANTLRNAHLLSMGQDLLIPRGAKTAPALVSGGSSGQRPVHYVVKRGDTLSEIAEAYGTSTRRVRSWNNLRGATIHPGDKLTLYMSANAPAAPSGVTVRIRQGDTLWDLARTYEVSLAEVLKANNLSRSGVIRPGDRIRIPATGL
jgi:membrane-bound lytic murein transglycosylase D